jgi:hypothetical protein
MNAVMGCSLDEGPALEGFDDEILFGRKRLVWICAAALWSALVEVTVEPQTEFSAGNRQWVTWGQAFISRNLLASTNRQTLRISLDEVEVLATPMKNFEAGVELVQKRFARAVEVIGHVQRTRCESTKNLQNSRKISGKLKIPRFKLQLTFFSVSSMTMRMGLSSLCILR